MRYIWETIDFVCLIFAGISWGIAGPLVWIFEWAEAEDHFWLMWLVCVVGSIGAFPFLVILGPPNVWLMYRNKDMNDFGELWISKIPGFIVRKLDQWAINLKGYGLDWLDELYRLESIPTLRIYRTSRWLGFWGFYLLFFPLLLWGHWRGRRHEEDQPPLTRGPFRFGDGEELPPQIEEIHDWRKEGL